MPRSSRDVDPAPDPARRGAVPVIALLLALYAAVVVTILLLRAPTAAAPTGTANVSPELQAALDEHARKLRGEIGDEFKKAVHDTKDQVNEAVRRLDERSAALQSLVDAGKRSADGLAKAASTRAELLEDRIKERSDKATEQRGQFDALAMSVRQLERRPVTSGPAPATPAPAPEPAKPPTPEAPPVPRGPSPEALEANKEKVHKLIQAIADPDLSRALPAATELGRLGDLEAVEPLVKLMQHRDPYAPPAAPEALGALRAADAVPALLTALLDKDPAVFLQAGVSLRYITGVDSQLSGDSSRKDRTEARDRYVKFWRENETAIRERLGQPAKPADTPEPGK